MSAYHYNLLTIPFCVWVMGVIDNIQYIFSLFEFLFHKWNNKKCLLVETRILPCPPGTDSFVHEAVH